MSWTSKPLVEVFVEALERGAAYKVRIQEAGEEQFTREIRLGHKTDRWTDIARSFDPFELGFEDTGIREHVENFSQINLFLPDDDGIACLDWEKLGRGRVFRRRPRGDHNFRRSTIRGPLRVGLVSTVDIESTVYDQLIDAIAGQATEYELEIKKPIIVDDWNDFEREIAAGRFQAIHVLAKTELTPAGPHALIGGKHVPLENVVRKIAQPGTRFVLFQDVSEDSGAIAALRWGAQSLPSNSEASVLLCSSIPSTGFFHEIRDCYDGLLRDEPLGDCVAHMTHEQECGYTSLIAHSGTEHGLDLRDDLDQHERRQRQIRADFTRLGEPPSVVQQVDFESAGETTTPLTELVKTQPITHQAENELKQKFEDQIASAQNDQPRYPAAWFYYVDADYKTSIPDTETLKWRPPNGTALEFHFWLDIVKIGIASITETPQVHVPESVPYPLMLQVTVWSEDFDFLTYETQITLEARGPTKHAEFVIKEVKSVPRRGELFVFIRYEGTIIAVFRVEAAVTEQIERYEGAQTIEHAYLAKEWFRFEEAPSASALSIFITNKRSGALQVFTLKATGNPWATIGPTEQGLYWKNKEIYQAVQTLAHRAKQAAENKEEFKFAKEAKQLAKLGYPLFGDVFLQGGEDAAVFADDYIRNLPEGANLTIVLGRDVQNLYIPWGLLYDRQPPLDHFDTPTLHGFLGYRYNLVVRPPAPHEGRTSKRQFPIRLGAAWLEHEETARLRDFYKPYQEKQQLIIEPIKAEGHTLPALSENEFDMIEFFCHGHTKLSGVFTAEEARQLIDTYAKSASGSANTNLLMAIEQAGDSLVELSGGFVTLTSLADTLKKSMPGHPLILLSMCESAQVSMGGTGFVPLFLRRGARAIIGTEGPTLWSLSRQMDTKIIARLLDGQTVGQAFYETRKELAKTNVLALIYTLYGDAGARLV